MKNKKPKNKIYPTQNELKQALTYNPHNGSFTWERRTIKGIDIQEDRADKSFNTRFAGKLAGYPHQRKKDGKIIGQYTIICVNQCDCYAHRLAWIYMFDKNEKYIDHRDGDGTHNWIDNLRSSSMSQNMMNTKKRKDNTSGFRGVSWSNEMHQWQVNVTKDGDTITKFFKDKNEANEWGVAKRKELFGEFHRT